MASVIDPFARAPSSVGLEGHLPAPQSIALTPLPVPLPATIPTLSSGQSYYTLESLLGVTTLPAPIVPSLQPLHHPLASGVLSLETYSHISSGLEPRAPFDTIADRAALEKIDLEKELLRRSRNEIGTLQGLPQLAGSDRLLHADLLSHDLTHLDHERLLRRDSLHRMEAARTLPLYPSRDMLFEGGRSHMDLLDIGGAHRGSLELHGADYPRRDALPERDRYEWDDRYVRSTDRDRYMLDRSRSRDRDRYTSDRLGRDKYAWARSRSRSRGRSRSKSRTRGRYASDRSERSRYAQDLDGSIVERRRQALLERGRDKESLFEQERDQWRMRRDIEHDHASKRSPLRKRKHDDKVDLEIGKQADLEERKIKDAVPDGRNTIGALAKEREVNDEHAKAEGTVVTGGAASKQQSWYFCGVCKVKCTSSKDLECHKKGKKHIANLELK